MALPRVNPSQGSCHLESLSPRPACHATAEVAQEVQRCTISILSPKARRLATLLISLLWSFHSHAQAGSRQPGLVLCSQPPQGGLVGGHPPLIHSPPLPPVPALPPSWTSFATTRPPTSGRPWSCSASSSSTSCSEATACGCCGPSYRPSPSFPARRTPPPPTPGQLSTRPPVAGRHVTCCRLENALTISWYLPTLGHCLQLGQEIQGLEAVSQKILRNFFSEIGRVSENRVSIWSPNIGSFSAPPSRSEETGQSLSQRKPNTEGEGQSTSSLSPAPPQASSSWGTSRSASGLFFLQAIHFFSG